MTVSMENDFIRNTLVEKYKMWFNLYPFLALFSTQETDYIFFYFSQKTGFDISCKLSPTSFPHYIF